MFLPTGVIWIQPKTEDNNIPPFVERRFLAAQTAESMLLMQSVTLTSLGRK